MGWQYIASMINPADIASRGTTPKQLSEHESWFKGPSFLWENNGTILNSNPLPDLDPEDAEVRKEKSVALISNKVSCQGKEPNTFPKSWNRNVSTTHHLLVPWKGTLCLFKEWLKGIVPISSSTGDLFQDPLWWKKCAWQKKYSWNPFSSGILKRRSKYYKT